MKKSVMFIGLLILSISAMGGVEPSKAGVCFVVNGDCGQKINVKGCENLGNLRNCVAEGMLPDDQSVKQCTSGGVKYTSDCLCDQKVYKYNTAALINDATYQAGGDTCKDRTGSYCTQKLCRDTFKYIRSACDYDKAQGRRCFPEKIYKENGNKALTCGDHKKAAGSSCQMLYGPSAKTYLYAGCDCDPSYYPYSNSNKRQYVLSGSSCTGITDGVTRYTDLACPATYPSTSCSGNMVPEKTLAEVTLLGAPTCYKCREKTCGEYGTTGDAYYADTVSCKKAESATQTCVKVDTSLTGTRTCYHRIDITCPTGYDKTCPDGKTCETIAAINDTTKTCYKERGCSVVGGITRAACVAKIDNTAASTTHYCRKDTEFDDCYHYEEGGTCPVVARCTYDSKSACESANSFATCSDTDGCYYPSACKSPYSTSKPTLCTYVQGGGMNLERYVTRTGKKANGSTLSCYTKENMPCSSMVYQGQKIYEGYSDTNNYYGTATANPISLYKVVSISGTSCTRYCIKTSDYITAVYDQTVLSCTKGSTTVTGVYKSAAGSTSGLTNVNDYVCSSSGYRSLLKGSGFYIKKQ